MKWDTEYTVKYDSTTGHVWYNGVGLGRMALLGFELEPDGVRVLLGTAIQRSPGPLIPREPPEVLAMNRHYAKLWDALENTRALKGICDPLWELLRGTSRDPVIFPRNVVPVITQEYVHSPSWGARDDVVRLLDELEREAERQHTYTKIRRLRMLLKL